MVYSKIIKDEGLFKEAKEYLEEELKTMEEEIFKAKRELIQLKIKINNIVISNKET